MFSVHKSNNAIVYPERVRYAFAEMAVGDNIFLADYRKAQSARVSAIQYSKRHQPEWRFSIRKMDGGWRLFRIS